MHDVGNCNVGKGAANSPDNDGEFYSAWRLVTLRTARYGQQYYEAVQLGLSALHIVFCLSV